MGYVMGTRPKLSRNGSLRTVLYCLLAFTIGMQFAYLSLEINPMSELLFKSSARDPKMIFRTRNLTLQHFNYMSNQPKLKGCFKYPPVQDIHFNNDYWQKVLQPLFDKSQ